jgi:hypothetical protein
MSLSINDKYIIHRNSKDEDLKIQKIISKLLIDNKEYTKINDEINTYKEQLPFLIQQYSKSYYNFYIDNKNQEKRNFFITSQQNLNELQVKIDNSKNYINEKLIEINKLINLLNNEIDNKKKENKMLNDTLINIKNIQNGSVNMVYDYKNNYINLQIENVGLSLGIIYLTYLIIFGAFKEVDPYRKFVDKYKDNVVDLKNKLSFLKNYLQSQKVIGSNTKT